MTITIFVIFLGIVSLLGYMQWKRRSGNTEGSSWQIGPMLNGKNYSVGYSTDPEEYPAGGCQFSFIPGQHNHVHYLTREHSTPLSGSIKLEFEIIGDGTEFREPGGSPARVVPYFSRKNNKWGAKDPNERWWAKDYILEPLKVGKYRITIPLRYEHWSNVFGQSTFAEFTNALSIPGRIGLTFGGGSHYGHGVWANKPATFILHKFELTS